MKNLILCINLMICRKISVLLINGYSDAEIVSKLNIPQEFYNLKVDDIKRIIKHEKL